jgi:DNA modification methylase
MKREFRVRRRKSAAPNVRLIPIADVQLPKRLIRTHSKKQIKQIANSIVAFGWTYPILVDEQDNVIAGVGRYLAAKQLRIENVPVIAVTELSSAEKRALALADNKIAANAGYDRAMLAEELGELAILLPEYDLDIEITGFEPAEIDNLMEDFSDPEADPADRLPSPSEPGISRRGDLWELGNHRLFCGDALDPISYGQLMDSDRATMTIADPPYNVRVKDIQGRGEIKHREFAQGSGEMSRAEFTDFLKRAMSLAARHSTKGSLAYWCMDWRHLQEIQSAGEDIYGPLTNLIVWAKTNGGQGSLYRSAHELILLFKVGGGPHLNNVELGKHGRNRTNVWTYAGVNTFRAGRMADLSAHPTVKPVALVADAMRDCSRRGAIVLDPFVGSGTTILAAERIGRRAFGIELDPLYVDTAIRRWQNYTGRDAVLQSSGKTFEEVSALRRARVQLRRVA